MAQFQVSLWHHSDCGAVGTQYPFNVPGGLGGFRRVGETCSSLCLSPWKQKEPCFECKTELMFSHANEKHVYVLKWSFFLP